MKLVSMYKSPFANNLRLFRGIVSFMKSPCLEELAGEFSGISVVLFLSVKANKLVFGFCHNVTDSSFNFYDTRFKAHPAYISASFVPSNIFLISLSTNSTKDIMHCVNNFSRKIRHILTQNEGHCFLCAQCGY